MTKDEMYFVCAAALIWTEHNGVRRGVAELALKITITTPLSHEYIINPLWYGVAVNFHPPEKKYIYIALWELKVRALG